MATGDTVRLPLKHECGTRTMFGKPYHWRIVNGAYTLIPGRDPDEVTADALRQHTYPGTVEAADG